MTEAIFLKSSEFYTLILEDEGKAISATGHNIFKLIDSAAEKERRIAQLNGAPVIEVTSTGTKTNKP